MDKIKKHRFHLPNFRFLSGEVIDVEIGYETYGQLNSARNNAILVCHYWTGTSHAAGKYAPSDPLPGWWDALIGPGKAIDTDRSFVISSDTLSNVQANDPGVISAGPSSINPATGAAYGSYFPRLTFRDIVRVQRALMDYMSVARLHAVGGPSGGGMQALEWACEYPEFMDKVFGVCTFGRSNPFFTMGVYRWCRAFIQNDPHWHNGDYYNGPGPQEGLRRALNVITLLAQTPSRVNAVARASETGWKLTEGGAPLDGPDGLYPYEVDFGAFIDERAKYADANAFLTIGRAAVLHDVGFGRGGFKKALSNVEADILMISCEQDLYFPLDDSRDVVQAVTAGGGQAEMYPVKSHWGHFACIFDSGAFASKLHDFLYH